MAGCTAALLPTAEGVLEHILCTWSPICTASMLLGFGCRHRHQPFFDKLFNDLLACGTCNPAPLCMHLRCCGISHIGLLSVSQTKAS